jgi:hypothetical protein
MSPFRTFVLALLMTTLTVAPALAHGGGGAAGVEAAVAVVEAAVVVVRAALQERPVTAAVMVAASPLVTVVGPPVAPRSATAVGPRCPIPGVSNARPPQPDASPSRLLDEQTRQAG